MTNKHSFFIVSAVLVSLCIVICFQNCGTKGTDLANSEDDPNDIQYYQSIDSSIGLMNSFEIPMPIMNTSPNAQILGTCIIENPPRGILVTMNRRFAKSDCVEFCRSNSLKFDRDRLSCRFDGDYILYFRGSWFDKNHCTIKSDGAILLDTFGVSKQKCDSQCSELGQPLPPDKNVECYWQNQILKLREQGGADLKIGQCKITVKANDPIDVNKSLDLFVVNYSSGTIEKHCDFVKGYLQTFLSGKLDLREITQDFN